ncbi:MAG TPA: sigma-70 family RNA polymerase sigma factor [Phycisphaerales bacterium]|nr:sigma-70 family RNA polymerase sigma factor [Phycisphaerales bacterium]
MGEPEKKAVSFFRLYTSIQSRLYAFILTMVHNEHDAEELLQETAVYLWEQFDQYEPGTNFWAWAACVARFRVLDFHKKNRKTRPLFDNQMYRELFEIADAVTEESSDRRHALKICMEKLKSSDQKLLQLRFDKSYSIQRIAQLTGRSRHGLYKTMARILGLVRECMQRTLAQWDYPR